MNSNSCRELLEALTSSIEEDAEKLSAKAGALIYSKNQSSDQYLLLLSGSIRLVDQNRTFGSLTAGSINSPEILGIENLLSLTSSIEVRCATECSYILVEPETISKNQFSQIQTLLTKRINPTEAITIYSLVRNNLPNQIRQIQTLEEVLESIVLLEHQSETNNFQVVIYLDKERDGFSYGQLIPLKSAPHFLQLKTGQELQE